MAKYEKGILGHFTGTVGTVVGSSWKDVQYMRSKPNRKNRAASDAQLKQRAKVTMVGEFFKPLTKLVRTTFSAGGKMTGINRAVQYALKNAISGTAPDFTIDYSKVLISQGNLPNESDAKAVAAAGAVTFTWTNTSGNGLSSPTDKAILLVHCEALKSNVFTLNGADRSAGTATLNVPDYTGQTVQTWIAFISADGKEVATSRFAGQLTIA
jgi:hypothetical protein